MAKKIGLSDEQTKAAIDLMTFIREQNVDSAEMDTNIEWKQSMVNSYEIVFIL